MEYTKREIEIAGKIANAFYKTDFSIVETLTNEERYIAEGLFEINIIDDALFTLEEFYIKALVEKGLHLTVRDCCFELQKAINRYLLSDEYDS